MNLVSKTAASSSTAQSSSASNCPRILKRPSQSLSLTACAGRFAAEDSNQNDAASSSQVWQSDAKSNASAWRPAATETNQNLDFLSSGKPAAEGSGIVDVDSVWPNNFRISVAHVPHLEKAYLNLRQKIGRKSGDDMNDPDTNSLIGGMFMSATLDAAVHLGKDYLENFHSTKNQTRRTIRQLFDVSQKLVTDQTKIQGISKIGCHTHP